MVLVGGVDNGYVESALRTALGVLSYYVNLAVSFFSQRGEGKISYPHVGEVGLVRDGQRVDILCAHGRGGEGAGGPLGGGIALSQTQ